MQGREVLPCQTGLVLRTGTDVGCQQGPCPGLRNANLKPDRHREETFELPEDQLLTGLGGDGLGEQCCGLSRIHVSQEPVYSRFAKACELLAEVHKFHNSLIWVVIGALLRCLCPQDVGDQRSMSNLLFRHKLNQISIFCCKTCSREFRLGETSKTIVEQVELDVFSVKNESLVMYPSASFNQSIQTKWSNIPGIGSQSHSLHYTQALSHLFQLLPLERREPAEHRVVSHHWDTL